MNTDPASGTIVGMITPNPEYESECAEKQAATAEATEKKLTPGAKKKNFTMAVGSLRGQDNLKPAFSNRSYYADNSKRGRQLLTGLAPDNRKQIPLCNGQSHPSNFMAGGHSEARIIGHLGSKLSGQTLVINVNLQRPSGDISKLPCPQCHELICAAMESCQATIIMCGHDNKGVDMSEACENGKPKKQSKAVGRFT